MLAGRCFSTLSCRQKRLLSSLRFGGSSPVATDVLEEEITQKKTLPQLHSLSPGRSSAIGAKQVKPASGLALTPVSSQQNLTPKPYMTMRPD